MTQKIDTMNRKWIAAAAGALLLILAAAPLQAQVRFETGSTDSVRQLALQEQKLVFIDLYATWCPPCRAMERQVFSREDVAEFMERYFVAAKYDIDKPTGRTLMNRYGRGAIPLYLVFATDGTLWGTIEGAAPAETFIGNLQTILDRYRRETEQ